MSRILFEKKNVLTWLLVVLFISGCRIEKRRYTSGFHVEWHHYLKNNIDQTSQPPSQPLHIKPSDANCHLLEAPKIHKLQVVKPKQYVLAKPQTLSETNIPISLQEPIDTIIPENTDASKIENSHQNKNNQPEKVRNSGADMSFVLAIASYMPYLFLALATLLKITITTEFFLLFFGLAILLALIAFIVGKKALKDIDKSPEKFRNRNMASDGMGISSLHIYVVATILGVILFIALVWLLAFGYFF